MEAPNFTELSVAGVIAVVLFWVLKFTTTLLLARKGVVTTELEPLVRKEIKEIHYMTTNTEHQKDAGQFSCVWKDRDEVRDLMEAMRKLVTATDALTQELKLTRNGGRKP